jgi:predicted protein tyrosine phosphatase
MSDIFTDNHASGVSAQGDQPRLVFVCSAGMLRSATGAKVFAQRNCNTRSCGTHDYALIPLSANLINWAHGIYFAHPENWWTACEVFKDKPDLLLQLNSKSQICRIQDIHDYDSPQLAEEWIAQVQLPDEKVSKLVWSDNE